MKAMKTAYRALSPLLLALFFCLPVLAQTDQPIDAPSVQKQPQSQSATVIVTATANSQRVRYISVGEVNQTRLQVFAPDGSQVYDSDFKLGNLIDWQLQDQQGTHLTDGTYLFLVTVEDFSGNLTQKYGTAQLEQEQVYLQQNSRGDLSAAQATSLEANKLSATLSPIDRLGAAGLNRTTTSSTDGATTIDTVQSGKNSSTSKTGQSTTNAIGTGTQSQIAKWTDNAGTLGDSAITEAGGNVGIGTTNPQGQLHIFGTAGRDIFAGMGPDLVNGPAFNFGYAGSSFGRGAGFFNVRPDASSVAPNPSLRFGTANVQRMIITNTGSVGIGTLAPQSLLDVAGNINTSSQYNISGNRVLGITGAGSGSNSNTFVGVGAGVSDTPSGTTSDGNFNSFFGLAAGVSNSTGSGNSFFEENAGFSNTTESFNSYFGQAAGASNTSGSANSFFGYQAGSASIADANSFFGYQAGMNSVGFDNSFFGTSAGSKNTSGNFNAFFGASSGSKNTDGYDNAFFGSQAGLYNTMGTDNTFVGYSTGFTNDTGSFNTTIGYIADVASGNLTNATAIGARAQVSQSNSLVLGSINGINSANADTNVGIGTTAPTQRLTIKTATSSYGFIHTDGTITVGSFVGGGGNGGYLGTKSNHPLHLFVNDGPPSLTIDTSGNVRIVNLGSAGATQLCRNASNQISTCSSSLRYKTNIASFHSGLNLVNRLQPITFNWKAGGQADLGLAAEDVAKVEPLLVTYNDQGEVEGVKYDRVAVVLLNAVKQQQSQIAEQRQLIQKQNAQFAQQQKQLERQLLLIENLRRLVCSHNPRADVCK